MISIQSVKFIVDSNILSERMKPQPNRAVVHWLSSHRAALAVNPIILGEVEFGILSLPPGRRRSKLLEWFESGAAQLPVLDLDTETAHVWASLLAQTRRKGHTMPTADSLVAATAIQHGLAIATRNVAHYRNCGVEVVNPFDA